MSLSVHNLTIMVPKQTSAATARLGTSVYGAFSSIEVGWTVSELRTKISWYELQKYNQAGKILIQTQRKS